MRHKIIVDEFEKYETDFITHFQISKVNGTYKFLMANELLVGGNETELHVKKKLYVFELPRSVFSRAIRNIHKARILDEDHRYIKDKENPLVK